MALGLIGRKIGMTRLYADDGKVQPVTVLEVTANRVTRVKNADTDGYRAVQVTTGSVRPDRLTKPEAGVFAKLGVEPGRGLWEFRLEDEDIGELTSGSELKVDLFAVGQKVDVQGTSHGKGFAGVVKKYGFHGGRASHGASLVHRAPGSIGQRQTPGRVFPGKKMAGQLGNARRTQKNLEVVEVDPERNLLFIKGAIPGPKGGDVIIRPSGKTKNG